MDAPSLRGATALTTVRPWSCRRRRPSGSLIWAPVRRQWKLGVVLAVTDQAPDFEVRDVYAIVEPAFRLSAEQLETGRWLSRRYLCGLFDALRPMLPPGATHRHRRRLAARTPTDINRVRCADARPATPCRVRRGAQPGHARRVAGGAEAGARAASAGAALERAGIFQRHAAISRAPSDGRRDVGGDGRRGPADAVAAARLRLPIQPCAGGRCGRPRCGVRPASARRC